MKLGRQNQQVSPSTSHYNFKNGLLFFTQGWGHGYPVQGSRETGASQNVLLSGPCQILECLAEVRVGSDGHHWHSPWEWVRWLLLGQSQAVLVQLGVQVS